MKHKTLAASLTAALLLAAVLLAGCGGPAEPAAAPEPAPAATTEPTPEPAPEPEAADAETTTETWLTPLQTDELVNIAFDDAGISVTNAEDLTLGLPDDDENRTLSFTTADGSYLYKINQLTGEIVECTKPLVVTVTDPPADPGQERLDDFSAAINASMGSLEGYHGGAENIRTTETTIGGVRYILVSFDWDGAAWEFCYDPAQGALTGKPE